VAVVQISKIQHRRGKETITGLPQLASAELGWAVDTQKLYIGNGSVDEGAPAVGNTEILTEKTNILREEKNVYTFKVSPRANKFLVSQAIKTLFEVEPNDCNIVNVKGKRKMVLSKKGGRKGYGKSSSWKKAYITLKEGDKLNIFEEA